MPDLGRYAEVIRYWQAGFDTAWIADRLRMQEHLVARWVARSRARRPQWIGSTRQSRRGHTMPERGGYLRGMPRFLIQHQGLPGCWLWRGYKDKDGYGHTKINGQSMGAHRAAYILARGPIPAGLNVCHSCDNPACCRPDHLFLGTQKENCQDARRKDRHSRGTRNGISKLTDDAVRDIRASSLSQVALGKKYGVTQGTIWHVLERRHWAHVK